MKQRSPVRKRKKLLVQFRDHTGGLCNGWTRDLSPTGLFVVSDPLPRAGDSVNLKLHLPRGIVLELTGTVVRVGRGSTSIEGSAPMGFGFKLAKAEEGYFKLFETL